MLSGGSSRLQSVGTTGNEALHASLRASFRQVYSIHAPIMKLRLRLFTLARRVEFEGEIRAAGLRQRRPGEVLARVLARPLLDVEEWQKWCVAAPSGTRCLKAQLPVRAERRKHVERVRAWKKGKATLRPIRKKKLKRHVFNRQRADHLMWKRKAPLSLTGT